ncbi:MAG: alanine dehydrogenase [Planctomycetota bacterium]
MTKKIAIVREWKTENERRSPVTPQDVKKLIDESGLAFSVEPSPNRIFPDTDYSGAGAELTSDLDDCDFFVGIKEMPMDKLHAKKPHLFFSHTIKGQEYNMPLLRRMLDLECTLMDFELVRNDEGFRLIFFGRQAGQAGMLNTLWAYGQRQKAKGLETPFTSLTQARFYNDLDDGLMHLEKLSTAAFNTAGSQGPSPIVCGITGTGNVSKGAQEVLAVLNPIFISPSELLAGKAKENPDRVHQVIFDEPDMVRRKDGSTFDMDEYHTKPELYESAFADHLDHLSMIVTGHFWDVQFPRLVTKDDVAALFERTSDPNLQVIGDVSCDPEGGIEVTLKATYPDNPCYVYHSQSRTMTDGFEGEGLVIMAVEILPTELALDSSQVFSKALRDFLPDVLNTDFSASFESLGLPAPFKRAVIAHQGQLVPEWQHLLG